MSAWFRQRGMALVTALFVVLLLHALVAVILAGLWTDTGVLRLSDRQTASFYQAKAGIHYALEQLAGPDALTWETAHLVDDPNYPANQVPTVAAQVPLDGTVMVWVQNTSNPSFRLLRAAARQGEGWTFVGLTARRWERIPGLTFAFEATPPDTPDTVYSLAGDDPNWNVLGMPPAMIWDGPAPRPVPEPPHTLLFPEADNSGNLYVQGLTGDGISSLRYDSRRTEWGLLPTVPSPDVYGLAAGGGHVYAASQDQIFDLLDPEAATWFAGQPPSSVQWTTLEKPPTAWYDRHGDLQVLADRPCRTFGLDADDSGNLYARLMGPTQLLARRDAQTGNWDFLPQPPPKAYQKNAAGEFEVVDIDLPPQVLSPPTVDGDGNLFCLWQPPGRERLPDTIFKFVPEGRVVNRTVQGQWKVLPPAPLKVYDLSGNLHSLPDELARDFQALEVDSQGRLLVKYNVPNYFGLGLGVDTVYRYDTHSGKAQMTDILPPIQRQKPTGAGPITLPGYVTRLPFLGAGGSHQPGQLEYVPLSWF
ncbi:MAG: hypothetical protein AB7S38_08805 [Vulcanimicrobiota bacterium]